MRRTSVHQAHCLSAHIVGKAFISIMAVALKADGMGLENAVCIDSALGAVKMLVRLINQYTLRRLDMSKPVLFVTGLGRELSRAENLMALYNAYDGDKYICHICNPLYMHNAKRGDFSAIVIDIFPTEHYAPTIMAWHSIQGGKHIGLDEKGTYYRHEYADNMDYVIAAGSGYGREMWQQCTGVPLDKIVDFGMARTDRYVGKKKGDGHTVLADKKAYLYAPTFRQPYETPLPTIDWEWLDEHLSDDELFVVKAHPQSHALTYHDHYKHIIEADRMEPTVNYLYDADVVITDYSSVIFDGYLLHKPAVLFEKNPGYTMKRGMYLDYPYDYCTLYATDEYELLMDIRLAYATKKRGLCTREKRCINRIADACDGHSCERICELIKEIAT